MYEEFVHEEIDVTNTEKIKVSVIIATYNTKKFIKECLDSVLAQKLKPIEIILIDDGSTDGTEDVIREFYSSCEALVYVYQQNAGAGAARNRGIQLSKGEYLAFMDPDDKYPNNESLEKLYNAAVEHDVALCGGNIIGCRDNECHDIYSAGMGVEENTKDALINSTDYFYMYGHTRFLYKASLVRENEIEFLKWKRFEDQVFIIKALASSQEFFELDYPVYWYRETEKKIFSHEIWMDIFHAYADTVNALVQYKMELMLQKNISGLLRTMVCYMDKNNCRDDEEILSIVNEIDTTLAESGWKKECIRDYLKKAEDIRKQLKDLIGKGPVIIYGAGKNTEKFLRKYEKAFKGQLEGIAVTTVENNSLKRIGGLLIRRIDDYSKYKENATVLITPAEKHRSSIEALLKDKGYKNYLWIDVLLIAGL